MLICERRGVSPPQVKNSAGGSPPARKDELRNESMATVAPPPRRVFNREETQRKVRHPLQTVRKIIRGYVLLEGAAIAILFVAAWFWAGLFLDYGTFRLFAFDWLQE